MNTHIYNPRPWQPLKRTLADIEHDTAPIRKRARHSAAIARCTHSPPISTRPWSADGRVSRSDKAPPPPAHASGRTSPQSRVEAWLSTVPPPGARPASCPPTFDLTEVRYTRPWFPAVRKMAEELPRAEADDTDPESKTTSSDVSKKAAHPYYRQTLADNHIHIDDFGEEIPSDLKTFLNTTILKRREQPLGDHAVAQVRSTVRQLIGAEETLLRGLLLSDMFPLSRDGVGQGADIRWSTTPLPNDPDADSQVAAPKPDYAIGYSNDSRSWSLAQRNVLNSAEAHVYTQPGRNLVLPFITVEIKSEFTGGALHVAENQAAGSGSHSVNSLLWLYSKAGIIDTVVSTNKLVFSITMSHRAVQIFLHWYSEDDDIFYMSFVETYCTWKPEDIRACYDTVANIMDYGLGARKGAIKQALDILSPHHVKLKTRKRKNMDAN
ncbi:hypothetical protein F5Y10DRAFT_235015 [Nemania abortiva]|nr:hypothetical protein F5Y10DRAFT_235015 [Nemania abortiva]